MSKHTPGPWEVDNSCVMLSINRLEQPQRHIAIVSTYQTAKGCAGENEANARLIASSPKLLIALQDCISVMERELAGLRVIQPELNQARAAIAEATGET